MANIGDILGGAGSLISGIGSAYKNVLIGQATSGLYDAQIRALNTNTDIILKNIELSEKTQEENKKITMIQNKIRQDQYITEDEYNFISERANVNFTYDQYIDRITQPKTTSVLKETSQDIVTTDTNTQKISNKYLFIGGLSLLGIFYFIRRK